jgi:hypothetical protein
MPVAKVAGGLLMLSFFSAKANMNGAQSTLTFKFFYPGFLFILSFGLYKIYYGMLRMKSAFCISRRVCLSGCGLLPAKVLI